MALTIKLRQGTKSQLSTLVTGMTIGEPLYVTDTQEVFVATSPTEKKAIAIDLADFAAVSTTHDDDLFYMYDVSETGVKARKITLGGLKNALNIPDGDTDEKVAITSGGTAGYLGTNGADGVLRVAAGITMAPTGSDFSTIGIGFASQAQGDIIYRGLTDWARLEAGVTGTILQSGGAGANPSWLAIIDGGTFS